MTRALGRWFAWGLWALIAGWIAGPVHADDSFSKAEWALLPKYCLYTQAEDAGAEELAASLGQSRVDGYRERSARWPAWSHMHHYCISLMEIVRMDRYRADKQMFSSYANRAINNIDYVLKRCDSSFPYREEILNRRARLMLRLGQPTEALATAKILATEFPKAVDGYILSAESLRRLNRKDEARAMLDQGESAAEDKDRFRAMRAIVQPK